MTNKQGTEKDVLSHQGDTPEWEKEITGLALECAFDPNGPIDQDSAKILIEYVHKLQQEAYRRGVTETAVFNKDITEKEVETERKEIVEAIEKLTTNENFDTNWQNGFYLCKRQVISLITNRGK